VEDVIQGEFLWQTSLLLTQSFQPLFSFILPSILDSKQHRHGKKEGRLSEILFFFFFLQNQCFCSVSL